jgi:TPR repeat protein
MNSVFKQSIAAFGLLLSLSVPTLAGLSEDAVAAYGRGDYLTAVKLWRQLAEAGDATAQYRVGLMYNNGEGVPQDYAEAARWFQLAAEQGGPKAQFLLGFLYAAGNGVPLNDAEAARWFRLAADQGEPRAQFLLGSAYAEGAGLPQDYVSARMWFELAAAQGEPNAQKALGWTTQRMSPGQIAEAQKSARAWRSTHQPQ